MGDLEKVGMLKMDFLGLRTLTVVENTLKLIRKIASSASQRPRIAQGPRTRARMSSSSSASTRCRSTDKKTYELLQRGDARGVFQLESDGIRELLKRMKPDNIRDLIATNALYRPGPLGGGMVDAYVNRKHGREKPTYAHPIMEEILKETYGVIVYQEQCMRILNQLGGIELASAYACIKAISKKKEDIINARRVDFMKGAPANAASPRRRRRKSSISSASSAATASTSRTRPPTPSSAIRRRISRRTTPPSSWPRCLSSEIEDSNKRDIMVEHIDDARRLGAEVLPPNIQEGEADFTVKNGKIVFGLLAIKGLGRGAAEDIVRARNEGGPFKDFFDFCERIDQKVVPKSAIERLIKVGAFDCTGAKRSQLWDALRRRLASRQPGAGRQEARAAQPVRRARIVQRRQRRARRGQRRSAQHSRMDPAREAEVREGVARLLHLQPSARAVRGDAASASRRTRPRALRDCEPNQEVFIGGMLTGVRLMNTKKARNGNSRYARFKLEDFSGAAECVMWPDDYVKYKELVAEDRICFVNAVVERKTDQPIAAGDAHHDDGAGATRTHDRPGAAAGPDRQ